MHELSIAGAVVDTAIKHAGGHRVTRVDLRVGTLRMVAPGSLAFYFEIVARDGPCTGAELEIERVEALLHCEECGNEWDPAPTLVASHGLEPGADPLLPHFRCPACSNSKTAIVRGNELEVDSIEIEDSAEPAGQPQPA